MAYFKYHRYLNKSDHNVFDTLYEPGTTTPYSGILTCPPESSPVEM
jgi:hypothetical protein